MNALKTTIAPPSLLFLLFSILLAAFSVSAQSIEWQKNYGGSNDDFVSSIQQTTDGGYIMVGGSESSDQDISGNNGGVDYWILKTDVNGNIEWEQNYGGSGDDFASSVHQTFDGGYVVAGSSESSDFDVSGNYGWFDYWILKLDANGNIEWEQNYGGSDDDYAASVLQSTDSSYIVAGYTSSFDNDVSNIYDWDDFWVLKLDANGGIEWEQNYGGTGDETAASMKPTMDGGYVLAGHSDSQDFDAPDNNGDFDFLVLKLDSSGNVEWGQNYGGSWEDEVFSITQTSDGGYIVGGSSESSDQDVSNNYGDYDYWVIKLDANGNLEWEQNFGGSGYDEVYSVLQTQDGGYLVAGDTESNDNDFSGNYGAYDSWLLKLDANGNIEWKQNYGGTLYDGSSEIIQTTDGKYLLAGVSESGDIDLTGNKGGFDFWLVKIDTAACTVDVSVQQSNNTLSADLAGASYQWVDCDNENAPVSGAVQQSFTPAENGNYAVIITENSCSSVSDCYNVNIVSIAETSSFNDLKLFPNPTEGHIKIDLGSRKDFVKIEVQNSIGQVIAEESHTNTDLIEHEIDEESGIYFIQLKIDGQNTEIIKVIKK
ncbi:MAG: T9SS type A sorting domain-containing protein [Chitinophagales bacterium]